MYRKKCNCFIKKHIEKQKYYYYYKEKSAIHISFSIASYGSECWVLKNKDQKKNEAFILWCYHRLLRIGWTEKKTNEWILNKMDVSQRLLATVNL